MWPAWWTVGFATLAAGCQGEYPIAATDCDRWCDATQGLSCEFYDPAQCVSECEEQQLTRTAACRSAFDAALRCFRDTPDAVALRCSFDNFDTRLCSTEQSALFECVSQMTQPPREL